MVGKTMSVKYKGSWLAAWVVVLMAGTSAFAQDGIEDMQLFAPYESSSYGGGHRANQGFFFTMEGCYWSMTGPQVATIGYTPIDDRQVWWQNLDGTSNQSAYTMQGNSLDTSFLSSDFTGGTRIEFGNIEGHTGWFFSWVNMHAMVQQYEARNAEVYFADPDSLIVGAVTDGFHTPTVAYIRAAGVSYDYTVTRYRTKFWTVEADYVYRMHPTQNGGQIEWQLAPRYVEFNERLDFYGGTDPGLFGGGSNAGTLNVTEIHNEAQNHLIGPQFGVRWIKTKDRWSLAVRGALSPMWNMQSIRQSGYIGSNSSANLAPLAYQTTSFNSSARLNEFSALGEFRVEAKYQLTSMATLSAGWTGIFVTNLARPGNMINWTVDTQNMMGIITENNRQDVFVNGLTVGLEINR